MGARLELAPLVEDADGSPVGEPAGPGVGARDPEPGLGVEPRQGRQRLAVIVEAVELRERPALAKGQGVRRGRQRLVDRKRREPQAGRPLRVELDLSGRRREAKVGVADVGDPEGADAALRGEGRHGSVAGGGMVEDRVEGPRLLRPRVEVGEAEPPRQLPHHPGGRARLPRWLQHLRHQVEVRVRALGADLLEPGRPGEEHVGEAPGGVVREEVVADEEVEAGEAGSQALGVGERGEHVGPEEEQHPEPPGVERLGDPRHLVRDVDAGRPPVLGHDGGERLAVGRRPVAGAEPAAGDADLTGEGGQAADRPRPLPAVPALVHRGAPEKDRGRTGGGVAPGEIGDALGGDAGDGGRPAGAVRLEVGAELVEPDGVGKDEGAVVEPLRDDHVHEGERQGGVGSRADHEDLVRLAGRLRLPDVDGDHVGAAPPRRRQVAPRVRLAGQVGAPEEHEPGVGAQVLLGVDLEDPGQPEAEGAQAPADHGRVPPLAAVEVREAAEELGGDARPVVVGEEAVARPGPDRLPARRLHPLGAEVEGGVPGDAAPLIVAPARPRHRPNHRIKEPPRVADDLARGLAPDAEEPLAVRVVGVAAHTDEPALLHLHEHPAEGRMAVHRAHRADGPAHRRHPPILSAMRPALSGAGSWRGTAGPARSGAPGRTAPSARPRRSVPRP